MRRGSLFKLMGDCESRTTRNQRHTQPSAPPPTSPQQLPEPPLARTVHSQNIQSGFYDQGEPISLSVSHSISYYPQPEMTQPSAYNALATSYAYAPHESPQAFYVEPFEAKTNGESATPIQQETVGEDNGEHSSSRAPNETAPAASGRAESQPAGDLKPTPTEVMPSEDEEFEADLREILAGKKRYDTQHRRAVLTDEAAAEQKTNRAQQPSTTPPEAPVNKNEHAIFDRIAQSMKLANAYDLGSIALDQRFDAFDQEEDRRKKKPH